MQTLYALFPFEQVEKGARVIIYGAGRAGLNFVRQVESGDYCKVVAIVDKNAKKHTSRVKGFEALLELDAYDYVVVSLINFAVRESIKSELIRYGVPEEKIIVPSPKNLIYWSLDGMLQYSMDAVREEESGVVEMNARDLISADRLDIGIKWLLIRDLVNNVENPINKSLYTRHILAWTQGREGFRTTSVEFKDGVEEYIKCAKKTIESIKENKFDRENPVPLNAENKPLDGIHRIASCIEADEPIWVKHFPGLEATIKPYTWYLENGFTTEDMQRIYRSFCDLYPGNYGICVLYGPALELWDFMLKQLERKFKVVGYVDLDFESNYIAFETLINDMYFYKWAYGDEKIDRKINLLKQAPLKMRVVVVSDEDNKKEDLYGRLRAFKLWMREATFYEFENIELQFHSSDNRREAQHLSQVLLSPNNMNYIQHRFKSQYRKSFIDSLTNFKKVIMEHGVPIENVCVINSSSMEVMGLRQSVEIDFICLEEDYDKLIDLSSQTSTGKKEGAIELSIDLYSAEKARRYIKDDNCYYVFYGIKFLNLEYVREKKMLHNREKDMQDIRLIDLYDELIHVYDNKAALKKELYDEVVRRRLN